MRAPSKRMNEAKQVEQELAERREAAKTKVEANKAKKDRRNAAREQLEQEQEQLAEQQEPSKTQKEVNKAKKDKVNAARKQLESRKKGRRK